MTLPKTIGDWALHAYVDGELEPHDKLLIEKELSTDPEARQRLETWRWQKRVIKDAFAVVAGEPLSPGLQAVLNSKGVTRRRWFMPLAAVAVVSALVGGYAFYTSIHPATDAHTFAHNALSAHIVYSTEVRHPVEVLAAADKAHLESWISKRMGHKLSVPDLSSRGFSLVGGRLLHEDQKPAAQLMYEDQSKHRLTVYIAANSTMRDASFRVEEASGYTTCYWLDGHAAYAVASELAATELLPLAMFIYEALERSES